MSKKYKLTLEHHFCAAHHLELNYSSPCQKNHGHSWKVITEIVSSELDNNGMIIDFAKIKDIINKLDHQDLNEILDFNPTAENIARYIYGRIKRLTDGEIKVTVFESPNASVTYGE